MIWSTLLLYIASFAKKLDSAGWRLVSRPGSLTVKRLSIVQTSRMKEITTRRKSYFPEQSYYGRKIRKNGLQFRAGIKRSPEDREKRTGNIYCSATLGSIRIIRTISQTLSFYLDVQKRAQFALCINTLN